MAAHIAIQKSPRMVQAMFKHTDEHRARKIARLYTKGRSVDESKGTLLFWVPGGMPLLLHVEAAIAAAMKLRGYKVHAIICNSPYRACAIRTASEGLPISMWRDVCKTCVKKTSGFLEMMGIPYSYNGDLVSDEERDQLWQKTESITWDNLETLNYKGLNVAKNVRSSIIRYLQGSALTGHEAIVREFAFSALISACAAEHALERFKPWRIFMSHGVYVDWGPVLHLARSRDIPVTAWKSAYQSWHYYLRHIADPSRIDFKKLTSETWNHVRNSELTPRQNARLEKFFEDRYEKRISFDMRQNLREYRADANELRAKYAANGKPVWCVFSHINWDSVADFAPMAYPHFDDWIVDTIRQAIEVPEVQWLIKIHPIEAWDNPATGVQRLIERNFPQLPDHVRVIPAEEDISPANLYQLIDGGITVYGTAGLELALMGKPVIVAGEAHYGGLGFTYEGLNPVAYRALLRRAASIGPLTAEQRADVRKYAYAHFIQGQVPIPILNDPKSKWWNFQYDKTDLLMTDPFLAFICSRLIDGLDFQLPEELVHLSEREIPEAQAVQALRT
jgi:hypothetical protein